MRNMKVGRSELCSLFITDHKKEEIDIQIKPNNPIQEEELKNEEIGGFRLLVLHFYCFRFGGQLLGMVEL